jgi:hypothetical protein
MVRYLEAIEAAARVLGKGETRERKKRVEEGERSEKLTSKTKCRIY